MNIKHHVFRHRIARLLLLLLEDNRTHFLFRDDFICSAYQNAIQWLPQCQSSSLRDNQTLQHRLEYSGKDSFTAYHLKNLIPIKQFEAVLLFVSQAKTLKCGAEPRYFRDIGT